MAGRVRLGFIGAGTTVQQVHLPRFAAMPEVELLAICGQTEQAVRQCTRQFGIPELLTDYRRLLSIDELDAVVVAVPSYLHADIAAQALRQGKHVLCERPIGLSSAEAQQVEQAVRDSGKVFLQRLPHRFEADNLLARTFIQQGLLGTVRYASAKVLRRRSRPGGWYVSRRKAGGGALLHLGLPVLDLLLWFLEYPTVDRVSASTFRHPFPAEPVPPRTEEAGPPVRGWERLGLRLLGAGKRTEEEPLPDVQDVEDAACALVHLKTGVSLALEASWAAHGAADLRHVAVHGDQGGLELWPLRLYRTLEGVPVDVTPHLSPVDENAMLARHFVDCILKGESPQGSVAEGRALMATLDKLYEAATLTEVHR